MAHPFQQRKLLVTVCKAEIGWDQPDSVTLQSGWVTLVAGPFRASTRSVPVIRTPRVIGPSAAGGTSGGGGGLLSWAPSLGGELFVLTEDCVLVADMVVGAELWGHRGGRWNSETLYAQAEVSLDAAGQALLLSGRCLEVRLPLMQPQGQGGGRGKGAGGGGKAGTAAAAPPHVLGVLALSMLLQPSDAEAAVVRHLPVELVPRLLLDATRLMPGAALRGAVGAAYVDPCVVFLRVRLVYATGLGLGAKDPLVSRSSTPGSHHHHDRAGATPGRPGHRAGGAGGGGLPGPLQDLGARLQTHMDRTMGHVGAFLSRLRRSGGREAETGQHQGSHPHHPHHHHQRQENHSGLQAQQQQQQHGGVPSEVAAAMGSGSGRRSMDCQVLDGGGCGGGGGGGREAAVGHAAAEAVMSLLESNGFAVVDNRRLSNYFWCKVSYEGQYHISRLVAVSGGSVRWDETFVIAALRPVRTAPLEIELYGSNDSKSRGKVVCQLSVPLCDVVEQMYEHDRRRRALEQQQRQGQRHHPAGPDQAPAGRILSPAPYPLAAAAARSCSRFLQSAFASASAAAAAAAAAAGVDAAGSSFLGRSRESESESHLPVYHPDAWPRGHAVLTARIGGPGGAASATHGPTGGQAAARECRFLLELEVVDADPRARANATSLLPWAQGAGSHHSISTAAGAGAGVDGASSIAPATGVATPVGSGGAGVTATRQGSAGSAVLGFVLTSGGGGEGGGGADSSRLLSPPWSPTAQSVGGGGGGGVPGGDGGEGDGSGFRSPAGGGGTSGILSLGAVVATSSVAGGGLESYLSYTSSAAAPAAPPSSPPPPSPPIPGEEDSWLPLLASTAAFSLPPSLSHIRGHLPRPPASVFGSECTTDLLAEQLLDDEGPLAGRSSLAASAAMPGTPTAGLQGGVFAPGPVAASTAAAASVSAAPPPPGLCSTAALAASACATLSLVCHDVEVELPPPPEPPVGGSGAVSGGQQAQYAAAVASITQCDYFVAVRCGSIWLTTNSLRVVGAGGGGGGGADGGHWARLAPHLGFVAPLLKPSTLVSLALFRRTDTMAGKKVLNVRAMIGMVAAEQLVGKLRLRASNLAPGHPVTVRLPLKAERSGSRPCATVAWCRLTLLLSLGPAGLAGLLAGYAEPPTYPPVAMLQEGAVSGDGLSSTVPRLDSSKKVDSDTLKRRERRLLIKWVSEGSPGITAHTSRKLVEDGRTDFNLGRTTQHWRRIGRALSSTEPLKRFWDSVQSWRNPPLTLAVAAAELALLAWPSRTIAILLICLVVHLLRLRHDMSPQPQPAPHLDASVVEGAASAPGGGSVADGDGLAAAAATSGGRTREGGGEGGVREAHRTVRARSGGSSGDRTAPCHLFGEPCAMVDDISERDPEPATGSRPTDGEAPPTGGDNTTAAAAASGGSGGGTSLLSAAFAAISQSTTTTATAGATATATTTSTSAALLQMGSGLGSMTATAAPSPALSIAATPTAAASNWLFGSSPPTGSGGGNDWPALQLQPPPTPSYALQAPQHNTAAARGGGGGGSEVPRDPLAALRQQYDHMVYFGLRVQNVLDDIAGGMERLQALLSWRDPVATAVFAMSILLTAAVLWTAGMRIVLGAVLLYDLRPPRWRDPWLPPPANAFTHLPTRSDLMM